VHKTRVEDVYNESSLQQTLFMMMRALCRFPSLKIWRMNFLNSKLKSSRFISRSLSIIYSHLYVGKCNQ